jgi:hypothetical protein
MASRALSWFISPDVGFGVPSQLGISRILPEVLNFGGRNSLLTFEFIFDEQAFDGDTGTAA